VCPSYKRQIIRGHLPPTLLKTPHRLHHFVFATASPVYSQTPGLYWLWRILRRDHYNPTASSLTTKPFFFIFFSQNRDTRTDRSDCSSFWASFVHLQPLAATYQSHVLFAILPLPGAFQNNCSSVRHRENNLFICHTTCPITDCESLRVCFYGRFRGRALESFWIKFPLFIAFCLR
jgi:hypothetical protein